MPRTSGAHRLRHTQRSAASPACRPRVPSGLVCCWLQASELVALGASAQLAAFITAVQARHTIPTPTNVDMIMGGPPCQGVRARMCGRARAPPGCLPPRCNEQPAPHRVLSPSTLEPWLQLSGLNRMAKRSDILDDPKNRLIKVYYEMVEWFKPKWTMTEQVCAMCADAMVRPHAPAQVLGQFDDGPHGTDDELCVHCDTVSVYDGHIMHARAAAQVLDMFKKECGRYARFSAASLAAMRYQCRIGVLAAGDYGAAQVGACAGTWGPCGAAAGLAAGTGTGGCASQLHVHQRLCACASTRWHCPCACACRAASGASCGARRPARCCPACRSPRRAAWTS